MSRKAFSPIIRSLGQVIFGHHVRFLCNVMPWKEEGKEHLCCVRGQFFPKSNAVEIRFDILVVNGVAVSLARVDFGARSKNYFVRDGEWTTD